MLKKFRDSRRHKSEPKPNHIPPSPEKEPTSSSPSSKNSIPAELQPNHTIPYTEVRETPSPNHPPQTLGLHIVHQPGKPAPVDIIFVHGLGGDSRDTWARGHDPNLFWPGLWLPFDSDVGNARILTFGYNAGFRPGAPKGISNISDFAKELLYEMRFGKNDTGDDMRIGNVPIIFVVHSMGGLVVKKAYILGQNDEEYKPVIKSISAIVFLATPHRGTGLAQTLNNLLKVSLQPQQKFIADLNKSSPALEEINEQFRHIAPKLIIWSFYETLATAMGPKKMMVLEKESSVLGYPGEVSRALNADHHDVCKFSSTNDPNYVTVLSALKTLVCRFRPRGVNLINIRMAEESQDIQNLLGIDAGPEDDYNAFRRRWTPGTCDWIFEENSMEQWLRTSDKSHILWYSAPPASGKSILSTHIINHIRELGHSCQYFFFKFGDQNKRSLSALLRSLAYQISREIPEFRQILRDLSAERFKMEKADATVIWRKIFVAILFELDIGRPLFWVIDALDEADDTPREFVELVRDLPHSRTPINLLVVSRRTEPLVRAFDRISEFVQMDKLEKIGDIYNAKDVELLVAKEMKHLRGSDQLKEKIRKSVMKRASGNFLWVRLVFEEIHECHTERDVRETLKEIPSDMTEMYTRIELALLKNPRKSNKRLTQALFQWIICANRPLLLGEISQALKPEFPEFIDIKKTIYDVCGQFVQVDETDHVSMIHQTARDFLLQSSNAAISINVDDTHNQLFGRCILAILDPKLRFKITRVQKAAHITDSFLLYAASSWSYHLRNSGDTRDETFDTLMALFRTSSSLTWIHVIALMGHLGILVKAAKVLTAFISKTRSQHASKNPLLHRLDDLDLLELWAVDLIKVVGKFGTHLSSNPLVIYEVIPSLCPSNSALHLQLHSPGTSSLSISGIENKSWNDNLARLSLPNGDRAWQISCAGDHIAVLGSTGTIYIWNSSNFVEICALQHQEPVIVLQFNKKGDKLITYGLRSSKLWVIPDGEVIFSVMNPPDAKALAITFAEDDARIIVGGNDKIIRFIEINKVDLGWQILNPALLKEVSVMEGTVINSPHWIAFNGDSTQVGVSYRGFPLAVWDLKDARCIGRCKRSKPLRSDNNRPSTGWFAVDRFTWNPVTGHIIGIYKDGCIFKWHPLTEENQEVQSAADEVAASSDGRLFVTSDSNGTVKVWNFAYFSVIYQLSSADLVTGLAFSPDCRRFYDLRGCNVNAWESNTLIRFSETEETVSDIASESQSLISTSRFSEAHIVEYEAVSVVAVSPLGNIYCVGNEEGAVSLINVHTGNSLELAKFYNYLSVSRIAWGANGRHVAIADLGGEILMKNLESEDSSSVRQILTLPSPKINLEGRGIHQMLFNHDSSLLLVISEGYGQVWSSKQARVVIVGSLEKADRRQWLTHPAQVDCLLGFGDADVVLYDWNSLTETAKLQYHEQHPRLDSSVSFKTNDDRYIDLNRLSLSSDTDQASTSYASMAILTQDAKHVLVHTKEVSAHGRVTKQVLIFKISALQRGADGAHIPYSYIPPRFGALIEIPLGVLSGSRFMFLDHDLFLCSFVLGAASIEETLKRHYFVPRDWASTSNLDQCCMMADGTFLCSKDDKVAVITADLEAESF